MLCGGFMLYEKTHQPTARETCGLYTQGVLTHGRVASFPREPIVYENI